MTELSTELSDLNNLVSLCKRRGFIFPSSEIYGGINSCWDYGPLGVQLKNNLKQHWWKTMTDRMDIEGLDAAILMHPTVWEASGHVAGFVDPLVDCKNCKSRFRADKIDNKKTCPNCNGELTEARLFNLMFQTFLGPIQDSASAIYLRPETAQGIYVNFHNVQQSMRKKIPFGIAQIGKAFRNEITPGNFIFRTREFEQMEMQYFVVPETIDPHNALEWFEYWKQERMNWHLSHGISAHKLRFQPHSQNELAHYAKKAFDIEYQFPFGWQEIEGIHHRSDYDLKRHEEYSKKRCTYFDEEKQQHYIPYIIETSAGCDRTLLACLIDAYHTNEQRTWLKLHPLLAPIKCAVLPLMKKPDLQAVAINVFEDLHKKFACTYDDAGSIGKRYRRQEEIGTPYCITIDYESLSSQTVTIRDRDTMAQERIQITQLVSYLSDKLAT